MKLGSIHSRILATALLPVGLVVVGLVGIFGSTRVGDLNDAHQQRHKLLVNQLAQASEYGVFSGNRANLQQICEAALDEPDVRAVTIFSTEGLVLARVGQSAFNTLEEVTGHHAAKPQKDRDVETWIQPIESDTVELNDLFAAPRQAQTPATKVLGHAVVEISEDRLHARQHEVIYVSLLLGLLGLLLGGVLAVRLGLVAMRPIARVSSRIQRIGEGDFTVDTHTDSRDPLYELQNGLNQMATQLAWGRDELEQRVAQVTDALRLKKEEAESATLAKSQFLSAASHDLRQPTHALGLFIARLGQLPMDDEVRQLVGNLEASVQAMQDLLDGLLDLSRLESGSVAVNRRAVGVGGLFDAVRSALAPLATAKGLRLRVRNSNAWVLTDGLVLQRMVMNLVHNAIRYTQSGSVLLTCRPMRGGQSVRIEVWDSGIGISPQHQSEIFREFYQVANPGRDRAHGLGLGLSIVERSARLLGHTLGLRSNVGCGTRFSISVPIAMAPSEALDRRIDDRGELLGLEGLRVLVVEDDAMARDAIEALLLAWGCRVCAALSVEQAVNVVQAGFSPDVIVSDYRLGDAGNGLTAIATLRGIAGREVTACLMSGDTDGVFMQAARNAGLTLLHKPVRPAKLRAFLRRAVMPTLESDTDTENLKN